MSEISEKGATSFLANGRNGRLAVRVAPLSASTAKMDEGYDHIQLSTDNGQKWKKVLLPGNRTWSQSLSGIPRWVEPIVFDEEDRLVAIWSEGSVLNLPVRKMREFQGLNTRSLKAWTRFIFLT